MTGNADEGHPALAVEELRADRPWGGVVVGAGPLDLGVVPLRRRIVEGEDEPIRRWDAEQDDPQEHGGEIRHLAADAVEEVGVGPEVIPDAGGSPPIGGDAAAGGQKDADDDLGQPPGPPTVERGGRGRRLGGPLGGPANGEHPRPSLMRLRRWNNRNRDGRAGASSSR